MSRIDNATLHLSVHPDIASASLTKKLRVYATNYNVLRIMSGMGGFFPNFNVLRSLKFYLGPKSITQIVFGYCYLTTRLDFPIFQNGIKSDTSNCDKSQLRHYKIVRETPKVKSTKVCSEKTNWSRKKLEYSNNDLNDWQNAKKWAIRIPVLIS